MTYLTLVYEIKSEAHQQVLLAGQWIASSHGNAVLDLTKAAALVKVQQEEIENLNRGTALLRERLDQSEKSRKDAQIENEQLKDRLARRTMAAQSN